MTVPALGRLVTVGLVAVGLLGCLRAFGPDLRRTSADPHAGLAPTSPAEVCMGCHESESEALARIEAAAAHRHVDHSNADHQHPEAPARGSAPARPDELGPPLVADWMVEDERACVVCHRIRGGSG